MRFIPTRLHGFMDYAAALVLIVLPFYLGLAGSAFWWLLLLGGLSIVYALFTDYELGLVRFLRIRFHLLLDALMGIALLATPWLVDVTGPGRFPLYALGVLALILSATTVTRAEGTAAKG